MDLTTAITSFLIGLTGSLLASRLFLLYIFKYKQPNIEISKLIAKEIVDGEICYWFKVINKSSTGGFDIQFTLEKRIEEPYGENQKHENLERIPLCTSYFSEISKFANDSEISKTGTASHAIQVKTTEDLEAILEDKHNALQLQVFVKHGLSGLPKSFPRHFVNKSYIVNGTFNFGNSLTIKKA